MLWIVDKSGLDEMDNRILYTIIEKFKKKIPVMEK